MGDIHIGQRHWFVTVARVSNKPGGAIEGRNSIEDGHKHRSSRVLGVIIDVLADIEGGDVI